MEFEIEKNVPKPVTMKAYHSKYPFGTMEVDDSFLIPNAKVEEKIWVRQAASHYAKRNNVKFVTRTTDEGLRVWRVQ